MLSALYDGRADLRFADGALAGEELAGAVGAIAARVTGHRRVLVEATPSLSTAVAVAGVIAAGATAVPLNPAAGVAEREHVIRDSQPDAFLDRFDIGARADLPPAPPADEGAALIIYTSGTTGPPKGAVLPRRALAFDLDALADTWAWTAADVLAHALPLFHVHGLVLGVLGPLRIGSPLRHLPRFGPCDASLYFAVPTMWSRLSGADLEEMRGARLLVSGSAALPVPVFERVAAQSGHRVAERYGLTETLITTAARAGGERRPGCVGTPLPGVELRLADVSDGIGEVHVRGPSVFSGYLDNPSATAAAYTEDGWFRTGDLASYADDGQLRIVGRKATDLIKSGGYKIGAGEVENALLGHPAVAEAAVLGLADDDLGERIVAWVVAEGVTGEALIDHVARSLAPHKRPREIRFVESLPRNPMGKVQKSRLV
jgi:fatty acid CoA ligase FadD36/malonyl-CoA/methylmalonyl-CoA synthetase